MIEITVIFALIKKSMLIIAIITTKEFIIDKIGLTALCTIPFDNDVTADITLLEFLDK